MEAAITPLIEQISEALEENELSASAPEAHGMLCGLLCAGRADTEQRWLDQLLPAEPEAALDQSAARQTLSALARHSRAQLEGAAQSVHPLLPDDERPLAERARALHDWVRGFLYAFGLLGLGEQHLPEQTREVLGDFSELTRMDLEALEEDEEHEQALAEILEFVRLAALLVYEERLPEAPASGERRPC
ncbi:MAG: UPF0149 family protein [Chromatiaceae bacterium]|nr:UPF0149 family protein [Chromatiaceae bacterium]